MQLKAEVLRHTLDFNFAARTSRGAMESKDTWYVILHSPDMPQILGIGECGILEGLSIDATPNFGLQITDILADLPPFYLGVSSIDYNTESVITYLDAVVPPGLPALRFGLETALLDLLNGGHKLICNPDFTAGAIKIPINGLIWMAPLNVMQSQIETKLSAGYNCLKLKIGALNWAQELQLITNLRARFNADTLTIRVDANGAFSYHQTLDVLAQLAALDVHSIEQPIASGQPTLMAKLCEANICPIALDEELIGVDSNNAKRLLSDIKPQYIILKPTLLGGLGLSKKWIDAAESLKVGWWLTSALESNIGLNAICQFAANYLSGMPQGLGTGQLYSNNVASPLTIDSGFIYTSPQDKWGKLKVE